MEPNLAPRYFRRRNGCTQIVSNHHYYLNERYSWSEMFFEQLAPGFWLQAIEIQGKDNNHYTFKPKRSEEGYYSINFLSTSGKLGYRENDTIHWVSNQVSLHGPDMIYELYQEKDTVFNCCRLIFTTKYLTRLINVEEQDLGKHNLQNMMMAIARKQMSRVTTKAEHFLQSRIFSVLKYERDNWYYRSSILGNTYELMAFYLKTLVNENNSDKFIKEGGDYAMLKAAKILDQQLLGKFPGILALAESCHVSPSKLKRDFRKMHGTTPLEYFRSKQIISVTSLLNGRRMTVKELALTLGFRKVSTFSTWHRKITGNDSI